CTSSGSTPGTLAMPTSSGSRSTARLATNATGDQEILVANPPQNVQDATAKQVRTKLSQVRVLARFPRCPPAPATQSDGHRLAVTNGWPGAWIIRHHRCCERCALLPLSACLRKEGGQPALAMQPDDSAPAPVSAARSGH